MRKTLDSDFIAILTTTQTRAFFYLNDTSVIVLYIQESISVVPLTYMKIKRSIVLKPTIRNPDLWEDLYLYTEKFSDVLENNQLL